MSTQAPEATGSPAGTEGTPQAGEASTTPEPQANGTGSHEPAATESTDAGTGSSTASSGNAAQDDGKTERTIAAIRGEFKDERSKRQAAEAQIKELRDARTADQAEQAKRMDAFAIALGLKSGDEPPDPAKLAEELERSREQHKAELEQQAAEIRQRDLRLAVLTQAPALEANGALLMDSMSFLRKLDGLDPAADDFSERVGEAIKAAAAANAQYKLAKPAPPPKPEPTVPRSGGEHNGAPGGNRQLNLDDVGRMTPREVADAQDAGLLIDLGFAPRKKRF
jgi:hypothetical protein